MSLLSLIVFYLSFSVFVRSDESTIDRQCMFMDIIFVVDGSGSIGHDNFAIMKQWLINQTSMIYELFGNKAQVGIVQFSDKDRDWDNIPIKESNKFVIPFDLGECANNKNCFTQRIMDMSYLGRSTFTFFALTRTMEVEFQKSQFFNISKKVVVVVTDGEANDGVYLDMWHNNYKDFVTSFAIGIGKWTDFLSQLQAIANGGTGNDRVYTVADFDNLNEISSHFTDALIVETEGKWTSWVPCSSSCFPGVQMRTRTCYNSLYIVGENATKNQTQTKKCNADLCTEYTEDGFRCKGIGVAQEQCTLEAFKMFLQNNTDWSNIGPKENRQCIFLDIIFVVDGSGSIGHDNFAIVKQWLINQTSMIYELFGNKAQVGIVQFSSKDKPWNDIPVEESKTLVIPFDLGECVDNKSCFTKGIMDMPYLGKSTYTYFALKRTMEVEFQKSRLFNISKKVVVVITDGEANDGFYLQSWYEKYVNNVTSFAIGIGKWRDFLSQLRVIANGGSGTDRVFIVSDFSNLDEISSNFADALAAETKVKWTPWSPCSSSCSPGVQIRTRTCNNSSYIVSENATKNQAQTRKCNADLCTEYTEDGLRCKGVGVAQEQCTLEAFKIFLQNNIDWSNIGPKEKIYESPEKGLRIRVSQIRSSGMNVKVVKLENDNNLP